MVNPWYLACEGRVVAVVSPEYVDDVLGTNNSDHPVLAGKVPGINQASRKPRAPDP